MAFTSVNGNAMYGTLAMVIPTIRTAVFSSPTTLGQIVISSIVGNFTSYTITRNGGAESASQTATTYTDTGIANNAQCTYTIVPYIGGIKGAPFTAITNPNAATPGQIYTLASPASLALTYVGANSTTTSVYFTWTNLEYSSIRLQNTTIVGGTVTTYTSASGTVLYNSSGKDAGLTTNVQYTYTATVVNGDGIGAGIALCQTTLATCTWASAASPTFSSTTYMGTTLGCTGTFSKAYVTYSPIAGGAPTTGTLINVANTISQAYLFVIYGVTYTFNVFPVNSLNYPDSATGTNFTTNSVAIPADGIVTSASFSSPTALGSITIGSIVGSYEYCFIYRGATYAGQIIRGVTTFTDPTALSNNTQYTYTIKPYDYHDGAGTVFTAITNPNAATPGQIYTLASPSSLSLTYSGANSTTTSVYFTWTNSGYSSIRLQNTTIVGGTVTTYTSASATVLYNSSGKDTLPAVNGSYTYTATVVNGDGYYVNGAPCQATLATCTWASAPTLSYNGAGCSATQISFTFSGGTYTNLSVQYPSGTEITKTTTSPYTGGAFSANQQVTYYVYPINALSYISSNGSSVAVCTLATCTAPTFSSTTSAGTTLACSGTFSKVYITYTGTAATPASGYTVTGTNSITQAYTGVTAGSYTFNCYPVNALNYQSTTVASASVTIPSSVATFGASLFNSGGRVASIGTNTQNGAIASFAISTGGKVMLYSLGNQNATADSNGTAQVYINDGNFGTTFTNINSRLQYFWTGAGSKLLAIGITNDGTKIVIFMNYTGTSSSTSTASTQPAWYVSTNSGATFTLYTGAAGSVAFNNPGTGQCKFSSDNQWCFASPLNANYNQSFYRNTTAGNFTAWTGYTFYSSNGPNIAPFCLNSTASIMYCTGGWYGGTTLMKSTNTGVTWSQTASGVLSTGWATSCVGCDSTGNIVYCTTLYTTGYYGRMFKSTNAGSTWAEVTLPFGSSNWVSWFEVDSTGNNIVLLNGGSGNVAATYGAGINPNTVTGLYISTNGGTSWTATTGYPITHNPSFPGGIYADSTFTVFAIGTSSANSSLSNFGMLAANSQGRLF